MLDIYLYIHEYTNPINEAISVVIVGSETSKALSPNQKKVIDSKSTRDLQDALSKTNWNLITVKNGIAFVVDGMSPSFGQIRDRRSALTSLVAAKANEGSVRLRDLPSEGRAAVENLVALHLGSRPSDNSLVSIRVQGIIKLDNGTTRISLDLDPNPEATRKITEELLSGPTAISANSRMLTERVGDDPPLLVIHGRDVDNDADKKLSIMQEYCVELKEFLRKEKSQLAAASNFGLEQLLRNEDKDRLDKLQGQTANDMPGEMRGKLKSTLENSFRALGFSSADEARSFFDGARIESVSYSLQLSLNISKPGGIPHLLAINIVKV